MKNTILIFCVLSTLLIGFIPIGSTGANVSNTEIDIETLPANYLFNIKNFKPGDKISKNIIIFNKGNKDFTYNIKSNYTTGSQMLFNQLKFKLEDQNSKLFEGNLKDFILYEPRLLLMFSEETLRLTVEFPYESGNEYQGLATEVEFILYAEGRNNPPDPPDDGDPPDPPDDGDPPDPPDDGDPPDPPDDGDPPDPPDDGDPPDPPDDGDPPDPPDDGDPPDPPDDGDPPDPPDDNEPPPNDNEPPGTNEPPSNNPTPTKPADPPSKDTGSLPQTGEENPIFIILYGFFISLAGIGLLLIKKSIIPNPFKRG
jgi:LPXTG-motif cell wall-anchored protein